MQFGADWSVFILYWVEIAPFFLIIFSPLQSEL